MIRARIARAALRGSGTPHERVIRRVERLVKFGGEGFLNAAYRIA